MKFTLISISLLLSILGCVSVKQANRQTKPNIIYIMADDLGYGDLGCYGQKKIPTPNLDKMAMQGMKFTDFYSGSTVCAPSRYALMTGMHMGHAFIRGNKEYPLRPDEKILPKVFKEKNYATGMFGKWGLGNYNNSGSPEKQGWDEFFGYTHHVHAHRFYTENLWSINDGKCVSVQNDSLTHAHLTITNKAFDFIKNHKNEPFLMYWAMTMPHAEMYAPEETLKKYLNPDGSSIFPENNPFTTNGMTRSYRPQDKGNANTAAMIEHLDKDIGRLFSLLKEMGLDKNTYVFFTSDNGPHNEGGRDVEFFDSNGSLKGFKRDLYEGGIRVPMIAWGANIPSGKQCQEPLANWDIVPTLAELIDGQSPPNIDGVSFFKILQKGKSAKIHNYLYWEFFERGFDQAVRMGKWKAIKQGKKGNTIELYDLSKDISENVNVAAQNPKIVTQMAQIMSTARVDSELFVVPK